MRYIGSKEKILSFIESCIIDTIGNIDNSVFADLLCGTTSVAKYFKKYNIEIITNDYMSFSYAFQIAYIKNNAIPNYCKLRTFYGLKDYFEILNFLNKIIESKNFFYNEYTLKGTKNKEYQRNYFSEENAIRIDSIRLKIEEWYIKKLINNDEYYVLISSLIEAVTKVSNISGTYGAFLKINDKRKFNKLKLEPINIINNNNKNKCYCEDIFNIIEKVEGDILYLDPPYNSRQYPPYYHILETVTLYDYPNIYGKTGRRPYKEKLSPFCIKSKAGEAIEAIIKKAKFEHIFLSYSNDGLLSKREILKHISSIGKTKIYEEKHRRFKSNSNGKNKNSLKEILIYVKKK